MTKHQTPKPVPPRRAGGPKVVPAAPRTVPAAAPAPVAAKPQATAQAPQEPAGKPAPGETNKAYKKRLAKLAPHHRIAVKLENARDRFAKIMGTRFKSWPTEADAIADAAKMPAAEARKAMDTALAAIEDAAAKVRAVPADWRPSVTRAGSDGGAKTAAKVEPTKGSLLAITAKHRDEYEVLLDKKEFLDQLTAVEVRGSRVVCTAPDGARLMIARGHLTILRQGPAAAPDLKAV